MITWLCIDVSCLCHRAWHALPNLGWKGRPTEVIYGFLNSVALLRKEFSTDNLVFCFDSKESVRRDFFPGYKLRRGRALEDPAKAKARKDLHIQIDELRLRHLPSAGFSNVFYYSGLESDDILAAIAKTYASRVGVEVILVTSDSDLWQCLDLSVAIYDPNKRKLFQEYQFTKQYGIPPKCWAQVKALAGCKTDEVPGIPGIGEKRALDYVLGMMDPDSKAYEAIQSKAGKFIYKRNRKLVTLPWESCPVPSLTEQQWNPKKWNRMLKQLGIRPR